MYRKLGFWILTMAIAAGPAAAEVLYTTGGPAGQPSYLSNIGDYMTGPSGSFSPNRSLAMSFVPTASGQAGQATLAIYTEYVADAIVVKVLSHASGPYQELGSAVVNSPDVGATDWVTATFATPVDLVAGTTYYLAAQPQTDGDMRWKPAYAGTIWVNSGVSWQTSSSYVGAFDITTATAPIPEPAAIGMLTLALACFRRR